RAHVDTAEPVFAERHHLAEERTDRGIVDDMAVLVQHAPQRAAAEIAVQEAPGELRESWIVGDEAADDRATLVVVVRGRRRYGVGTYSFRIEHRRALEARPAEVLAPVAAGDDVDLLLRAFADIRNIEVAVRLVDVEAPR